MPPLPLRGEGRGEGVLWWEAGHGAVVMRRHADTLTRLAVARRVPALSRGRERVLFCYWKSGFSQQALEGSSRG